MAYATGASFVLIALLLAGVLLRSQRLEKRINKLEKERLLEPATLLGTPFALERELANIANGPMPFSVVEILLNDPSRAIEAAQALRSACWHGMDQVFCLDLSRGHFLLLTSGTVEPASQASFFHQELLARGLRSKMGWAYTRTKDAEPRKQLRATASTALTRVAEKSGYWVEVVEGESITADDAAEVLELARARREAVCLSRLDFSQLVGLSVAELKRIETGRGCEPKQARAIGAALSAIEKSNVAVQALRRLEVMAQAKVASAAEHALRPGGASERSPMDQAGAQIQPEKTEPASKEVG